MIGWFKRWRERQKQNALLQREVERRVRVLQKQFELALELRRLRNRRSNA